MPKHTPGPWRCGSRYGRKYVRFPIYPAEPTIELLTIADVHTNEANARLIAAAPSLLEALQHITHYVQGDLLASIRSLEGGQAVINKGWDLICESYAAIAEAEIREE